MNRSAEKVAFWEYVLSEHVESGLSISAFCRREGVSQASFYQWRKKLAGGAVKARPSSHQVSTGFVPVEIVSAESKTALIDQPVSANDVDVSLTIRTPNGYAVDVSASTPVDLIERSLQALYQFHRFHNEQSS